MGKGLKRHFTEEDTQMATKHMKGHSASFATGEVQIIASKRCRYLITGIAAKKKKACNCMLAWPMDVEQPELV